MTRGVALLVALCLLVAACGDDDGTAQTSTTVQSSTPMVQVPDVVGQTADDARAVLATVGLEASMRWVDSGGVAGQVVEQFPHAGTEAAAGSSVNISVVAEVPPEVALARVVLDQRARAAGLRERAEEAFSGSPSGSADYRAAFTEVATEAETLYSEAAAYEPPPSLSATYIRSLGALASLAESAADLAEGIAPEDVRQQVMASLIEAEQEHRLAVEALLRLAGVDESGVPTTTTTTTHAVTTTTSGTIHGASYDLTIRRGSCLHSEYTNSFAGTIKNTTSTTKSYWIMVVFLDSDGVRVDDGVAIINSLRGGETATWEAVGFGGSSFSRCRVDEVEVYSW